MNDEDQNQAAWDMLSHFCLGMVVAAAILVVLYLAIT